MRSKLNVRKRSKRSKVFAARWPKLPNLRKLRIRTGAKAKTAPRRAPTRWKTNLSGAQKMHAMEEPEWMSTMGRKNVEIVRGKKEVVMMTMQLSTEDFYDFMYLLYFVFSRFLNQSCVCRNGPAHVAHI